MLEQISVELPGQVNFKNHLSNFGETGPERVINSLIHSFTDACVCIQGCVPCHELCENCTAAGLSSCSTCKYYRQDDRCVHECGADYFTTMNDPSTCHHCHSHCMQCHGPTAADCVKCKHYRIFADLALGKSEHDKQDHNEPMPVSPLFNI